MAFLGVNIDHIATVRNVRGGQFPDPLAAALIAEQYGADGITAHLREDRRHITDRDIERLKAEITTRLNMEMAVTEEMIGIACKLKPYMCTLVPERREELTTEGGLDVLSHLKSITDATARLQDAGIKVSLFIDPSARQVEASHQSAATIIEFHTGQYCEAFLKGRQAPQLQQLIDAAQWAVDAKLEVNAGHGLNYENVTPILKMNGLYELNIGHSIVAEALLTGFGEAVARMKRLITA